MEHNKEYDECMQSINNLTEEERHVSEKLYEDWCGSGRLPDMVLAKFMAGKIDRITNIMHESDRLLTRDGKVSRIKDRTTISENDETAKLKEELNELKGDIRELKELLINKLS